MFSSSLSGMSGASLRSLVVWSPRNSSGCSRRYSWIMALSASLLLWKWPRFTASSTFFTSSLLKRDVIISSMCTNVLYTFVIHKGV